MTENTIPANATNTDNNTIYITFRVPAIIFEIIDSTFQNKTERKRSKAIITHILHNHQILNAPIIKFLGYPEKLKQRLLTTRFYYLWEKLVDIGILELYHNDAGITYHWKRGIPKRYRIHPSMIKPPFLELQINNDLKNYNLSSDPLTQHISNSISHITVLKPELPFFEQTIENIYRKLRVRTTLTYISDTSISKINKMLDWKTTRHSISDTHNLIDFDIHNKGIGMINKLQLLDHNIIYASRSELNGRLNHNLTNIDKVLFPFLTLDGDNIMEGDLSNSQPLILSHLLYNILDGTIHSHILYDNMLYNYILYPHTHTHTLLSSHFEKQNLTRLKIEVAEFKKWCSEGRFYDNLVDYLNGKGKNVKRTEIKNGFTKVLFGKYNHESKLKGLIAERFPMIVSLLDGFKRAMHDYYRTMIHQNSFIEEYLQKYLFSHTQGKKNPYDAGNDYLAIRLQEIEANIFIDMIFQKMMNEKIIAFTRHDAVCFRKSDSEKAKEIITTELDNVFGEKGYKLKWGEWK